jgi:hypothetical protein
MKRPEQALHIQVADFLRHALGGTAMFFHVPNAARRGMVEGRIFKSMGVKAGMVDLVIIDGGRAFGIELKAAKGRVSEAQESAHKDLKRAGCPVHCAVNRRCSGVPSVPRHRCEGEARMTSYRRRKLARVALDALRIEYRRIARSGKYRDVERRR